MGFFDFGRQIFQASAMYDASISYYQRQTKTTVDLSAKIGKSHTVSTNIDGIIIHEDWIDFIVDFESLGTMPETGDVITYNGKRYAVSAPSDEKCYRWHILNQSLRIHAQQVEENG